MPRLYLFADESGDFTFNRNQNVSKYFILTTVSMHNCDVGSDLVDLRRQLIWSNDELGDAFHATTDKQEVRDKVFGIIAQHDLYVQVTIMRSQKRNRKFVQVSRTSISTAGIITFTMRMQNGSRPTKKYMWLPKLLAPKKFEPALRSQLTTYFSNICAAKTGPSIFARQRLTRACKSLTTAAGRSNESGSGTTNGPMISSEAVYPMNTTSGGTDGNTTINM